MQQTQNGHSGADHNGTVLRGVHFVCRSLASILEVPLHRWGTMGERYYGLQTGAAAAIMFFYTAFWRTADVRPVLWCTLCYLIMCALASLRQAARCRDQATRGHSYYTGTPRIMRLTRGLSEETVKRLVEPMLSFITGALIVGYNEALGTLIMLASFGLFATVNLAIGSGRARALDLNDAFLDQSDLAGRFTEMQGQ